MGRSWHRVGQLLNEAKARMFAQRQRLVCSCLVWGLWPVEALPFSPRPALAMLKVGVHDQVAAQLHADQGCEIWCLPQ